MYGNTHLIAEAIGDGLRASGDAAVVPVSEAGAALADGADLLVVGGPTHVHSMSRPRTRAAAVDAAKKPELGLTVEPRADGPGVRELLDSLGNLDMRAAAFDTRIDAPAALTGRASKAIARKLRHRCNLDHRTRELPGRGPALTGTAGRIGKNDAREAASSSTAIRDWNAVGRCHH